MRVIFSAIALAIASLPTAAATPRSLHSPWDAAPVALTQAPYTCQPTVHAARQMTITGEASKQAARDQDESYPETLAAVNAIVKQVTQAAQAYQQTGSQQAVECAANQLAISSQEGVMTGPVVDLTAAKHEIEALRALSIAYLVLQPSNTIREDEQQATLQWMDQVLARLRSYVERRRCGKNSCTMQSHTYLNLAVAGGAIAIASQDATLYHWAIDQYHQGVNRIEHGMLHYDTIREYALKFNTDSAAALVQLAEFGEANGEDLYAYKHGRLHQLVSAVARGQLDPGPFRQAAHGVPQNHDNPVRPSDIAWAVPYNNRFHDPVITSELRNAGVPTGNEADMQMMDDPKGVD